MNFQIVVKRIAVSTIVTTVILGIAGMTLAAEFSANYHSSLMGAKMGASWTGKVCVKGRMKREEIQTVRVYGQPGMKLISSKKIVEVTITGPNKAGMARDLYLNPSKKSYTDISFIPTDLVPDSIDEILRQWPDHKKTGTAKIAGYICNKYTITRSIKSNGISGHYSGTIWISQKLKYILKEEFELPLNDKSCTILSNIKEGPQDDSLFTIPAGYKNVPLLPKQKSKSMHGRKVNKKHQVHK